jgi:G3E family GTPase
VIPCTRGRIDPALVYDVLEDHDPPDQLPLAALIRAESASHGHEHATAVGLDVTDPVDADLLIDLLETPPPGVYRIKGCVPVRTGRDHQRRYVVHLVGRHIHVATAPRGRPGQPDGLVAIGLGLDAETARSRLRAAVSSTTGPVRSSGVRRLQRYRRLSL